MHTFFKAKEPTVLFDIFLHAGTLVAVFIFFRNDIAKIFFNDRVKGLRILIGTIPVAFCAVFLGDRIEAFFEKPVFVFFMFIVTGAWLLLGSASLGFKGRDTKPRLQEVSLARALLIGLAQAIALVPGISRSGATISTALIAGVEKESAFRFSFLLSIPAILGALVYKLKKGCAIVPEGQYFTYAAGAVSACIVGALALGFLLKILERRRLIIFSAYCLVLGLAGISAYLLKRPC